MWKFEFEAPVGTRILKRFFGATTISSNVWFVDELNKWMPIGHVPDDACASSHAICRTFKAFKRHLRKHTELRGLEVVLTSRFEGHNVTARWVE